MIGVAAAEADRSAVQEFFELFKTPWEFYRPEGDYRVLICSDHEVPPTSAELILLYGNRRTAFDREQQINAAVDRPSILRFRRSTIPLYKGCVCFAEASGGAVANNAAGAAVAVVHRSDSQDIIRIGYDLFGEVQHVLAQGQPSEWASAATVDEHIAMVRELIVERGIPIVEIPPMPHGYDFVACLTHDIDHPSLRRHCWDHTMFGFLYRATIGSFFDVCRGKKSAGQLFTNWKSAALLPFVYGRRRDDPWEQFDRYLELEGDLASTFFVLPHKGDAGVAPDGRTSPKRAAGYGASDIAVDLRKLAAGGREIALHGINAWQDASRACAERGAVQQASGVRVEGTRMHWLYFAPESPAKLQEAGFSYDSTVGFNETIGYRAGTAQVYKPSGAYLLLELPLHIMDTALFYRSYMDLSQAQASEAVRPLLENASRRGGVLTVNWHDRSLGPERLWGAAYEELLAELRRRKPWFATAGQAVSWFRKRRAASFCSVKQRSGTVHVKLSVPDARDDLPPLRVRVHNATSRERQSSSEAVSPFEDFVADSLDQVLVAA